MLWCPVMESVSATAACGRRACLRVLRWAGSGGFGRGYRVRVAGVRGACYRVRGTALGGWHPRPPYPASFGPLGFAASMSQYHFFRLMLVRTKAYYLRVYLLRVLYARRRHSNLWEHEGNHSTCRRISCTLVLTGYPWVASVIQESGHNTISVSLVIICIVVRIKSMIALSEHTHIC